MNKATKVVGAETTSTALSLELDYGRLKITQPAAAVFRLRFTLEPTSYIPPTEVDNGASLHPLTVQHIDRTIRINQGNFELEINRDRFSFRLSHRQQLIWESVPDRTLFVDGNGRRRVYQVKHDNDYYFGLGEKSGRLLRNNRRFKLSNLDAIGYDPEHGDPLYKHIPFYMKHHAGHQHTIGVFLNSAYASEFDFGSERSGYWGTYTSMMVDGGDLDLFLLLGPTPQQVLAQYHQITGFPALPTKASLGYLGSSMYYTELPAASGDAVIGFVDQCERHNIPLSGFHLSSGYTVGPDSKRYAFNWNYDRFPEPKKFVAEMAQRQQIISPNIKPGLLTTHPLWSIFDAADAFIKAPDGSESLIERFWGGYASFVDFSNPAARQLWASYLNSALFDHGITALWNDNNEFEIDQTAAICHNDGDITQVGAMRPVLANLMAQVAYETLAERNVRPFIVSRAGYAGIQKYAQTWSGDNTSDWRNFHFNLATMLGMSLSGMPFNGMDVGGFAGPAPTPELFLRWVQNAAFHPRFSIHSVNTDNTVTEPWLYPSITPLIRDAIRTRYLFLPTIYSLGFLAHSQGCPVVAPLFYHFPAASQHLDTHVQFMLGTAVMAVAITQPDRPEIEITFPPGRWRCFYSAQDYEGGVTYLIALSNEHCPLFYRAGHGFMLDSRYADVLSADQQALIPDQESLILHIDGRTDGMLDYYDDDGISLRPTDIYHATINWSQKGGNLELRYLRSGDYQPDWQAVCLHLDSDSNCPAEISLNGHLLKHHLYREQLSFNTWYYDVSSKRIVLWLAPELLNAAEFELTVYKYANYVRALDDVVPADPL